MVHTVSVVVCWQQASVLARDQTGQDQNIGRFAGVYKYDSTHEGWPVLKNAKGKYCYRYTPTDKWYLSRAFTPDKSGNYGNIVAKEGPLPAGAHTWQVGDGEGGWVTGGRTLTVGLLVRPHCPLPTAAPPGPRALPPRPRQSLEGKRLAV